MLMIDPGTKNGDTLRIPPFLGRLDQWQAADAGTNRHPDTFRVRCVFLVQTCITNGLNPRRHAEMDEGIHAARVLGRNIARDIEVLDLAGNPHRES